MSNDTINGTSGNDNLDGGVGNDTIYGGAGNDTILGGSGDDSLFGGNGNDQIDTGGPSAADQATGTVQLTWNAFYLGTFADMDSTEGNNTVENPNLILGTYGSAANPLFNNIRRVTSLDTNNDNTINNNDQGSPETLSIDGTTRTLDTVLTYNATVTFADGTTYNFVAVIFQTTDGQVYMAPPPTDNAVAQQLASQPIRSLSLNSVNSNQSANLFANRFDIQYQAPGVDQAWGGSGDDTLTGQEGNDHLYGDSGNDQLFGGAGNDTLDGGGGNDSISGGDGNDVIYGGGEMLSNPGFDAGLLNGGHDIARTPLGWQSTSGTVESWSSGFMGITSPDGSNFIELDQNAGTVDAIWQDVSTEAGRVYTLTIEARNRPGGGENDSFEIVWNGVVIGTVQPGSTWQTCTFTVTGTGGLDRLTLRELPGQDNGSGIFINSVSLMDSGGDDTLAGDAGNDTIYGGGGNDVIYGGADNDQLFGGAGDDSLFGGSGNDTLTGDAGNDILSGGLGNDSLVGGAGDDTIVGSAGADTFSGGSGLDIIDYSASNAGVNVNLATNSFSGGHAQGDVNAGGMDGVIGSAFNDTLIGFDASLLVGGEDDYTNVLDGGAGNDYIDGAGGDDSLFGGVGNDTILGGGGDDVIYGDGAAFNPAAHPSEAGGAATSFTFVNASDTAVELFWIDTFGNLVSYGVVAPGGSMVQPTFVGHNWAVYDATTGVPLQYLGNPANGSTVTYLEGDDSIFGGSGNDTIYGMGGNDTIDGGTGNDLMYGGADRDTFVLANGFGNDTIVGGETGDDWDTIDASAVTTNTTVTFTGDEAGTMTTGTNSAQFSEIEEIVLGSGNDTIDASATTGGVTVNAGAGADSIIGGSGNDTITAGPGADTIDAGAGDDLIALGNDGSNDVIRFSDGDGNDTITGLDAPIANGDGTFTGRDTLDVSGLTDAGGNPVDTADVTVTDDGSGNAVLTFPNGESVTLVGISPATANNPAWLEALGIPPAPPLNFIVEGTDGDDFIDVNYVGDPDGDRVDNNDAADGSNDDVIDAGAGNDTVFAGLGNDLVFGGDGNDDLNGGEGNDTIFGGDGNDTIFGETGDDLLHGDAGDDFIWAGEGNDTVFGGDGNDDLYGREGDDVLYGGEGDDTVQGAIGNDTLYGDAGNDLVFGGGDDDLIYGGSGNDTLYGDGPGFAGADTIYGDSGNNLIYGGGGDDLVYGGTDDDEIYGEEGNDTIFGGDGDDVIFGDEGADELHGGAGNDTIFGGDDDDLIFGGDGDDLLWGDVGADTIFGGAGNDTLIGGDSSGLDTSGDQLYGGAGDDVIEGGAGDDFLDGGDGNDTIYGGDDADTILGGYGFDLLDGGSGDDSIEGGFGEDTIFGGSGNDVIHGDYAWELDGDGDPMWFPPDVDDEGTNDDLIFGGAGDDTIYGGFGNDTIVGGDGDDLMFGRDDRDTFVLEEGYGNDTIVGGETGDDWDTIDATALFNNSTITFTGNEAGTMETGGNTALFSEIEEILLGVGADTVDASATTDGITVDTGGGDDSIIGGSGDDTITTGTGADTVEGGAGDDLINLGNDGEADVIVFGDGDGNDTITGLDAPIDNGDGTFTGVDTLDVSGLTDENGAQVNTDDVTVTDDGNGNAVLNFPNGESITLIGVDPATADNPAWLAALGIPAPNYIVEGTDGDDLIDASYTGDPQGDMVDGNDAADGSNDDVIDAGAGNDTVLAGLGDDTVFGGSGDDLVYGGEGNDQLFGGSGSDTIYGDDGDDLIDTGDGFNQVAYGGDGNDTITGGAQADVLYAGAGDDSISGGDGDDVIHGDSGNNVLSGDAGNDFIYAGTGNDTAYGGDGNDFITAQLNGGDNELHGDAGNDTVNGGSGNDTIFGGEGDDQLEGLGGDDLIFGGDGNDLIAGGDGNDTIIGGAGNDQMWGLDDRDTFVLEDGYGNDTIFGGEGGDDWDTLDASAVTGDTTVTFTGNEAGTMATGPDGAQFSEIEEIVLGSGNDTVDASATDDGITLNTGAGDDSIIGGSGDDTITAGTGADTVEGGAGDDLIALGNDGEADVIVFGDGDGNDTITGLDAPIDNGDGTFTGVDTLDVSGLTNADGSPVTVADVTVSDDGNGNAVLTFPNGESLTLVGIDPADAQNVPYLIALGIPGAPDGIVDGTAGDDVITPTSGPGGVPYIDADGDQVDGWDGDDDTIYGYGGNDLIEAGAGDDLVYGGDDNDTIFGGEGNDTLYGDAGNDSISGGSGDDEIFGGDGNDTIFGGEGNDTLHGDEGDDSIRGGDGDDLIFGGAGNDTIRADEGDDTVYGGDGDDVIFTFTGNDLVYGGDGDDFINTRAEVGVGVPDRGYPGLYDGDTDPFNDRDTVYGGAGNDTILTGDDNDLVFGGDGNDSIDGGFDDDTLHGDGGNDTILGGEGRDLIFGGDGDDLLYGGLPPGDADPLNLPNEIDLVPDNNMDTIYGGSGNDTIYGMDDDDLLYGGTGNDLIYGGVDNDTIYGGAGDDTLLGEHGDDLVYGGAGDDSIDGGIGDDTLLGGGGSDTILGGDGDDVIYGDYMPGMAGPGSDGTVIWLNSNARGLFRLEDINGEPELTQVSTLPFRMGDIGMSPDGTLYGTRWSNNPSQQTLHTIDPETGAVTLVGNLPAGPLAANGLSFDSEGMAYITYAPWGTGFSSIYRLDPTNPSDAEAWWTNPAGGAGAGDVVFIGDVAYATWVQDGVFQLIRLNVDANGEVTGHEVLGTLPADANGMTADADGNLYIVGASGAGEWSVFRLTVPDDPIDDGNGPLELTLVPGTTSTQRFDGATSNAEALLSGGPGADDLIEAGAGNDTVYGGEGNDTVYGGDGNDLIHGDSGDDLLFGGDGDDVLFGGIGNDTLDGGTGNDTLTGGTGNDVFVWTGQGNTVITDFGTDDGVYDDGDQTNNDFVDLSWLFNDETLAAYNAANGTNFVHPIQAMNHDLQDGRIDFNGTDMSGPTLTFDGLSGGLTFDQTNVICFVRGTLIATIRGEVAIEDLRADDLVLTMDNGYQPIRWIGSSKRQARGALAPVRIAAGALGNARDLLVSPQHRMLLRGWQASLYFGATEVLATAKSLINDRTIRQVEGGEVEYFHILFDQHEIIFAEGAPSESFHPGQEGWKALDEATRDEILAIFPELEFGDFAAYGEAARLSLRDFESRALAEALSLGY